MLAPEIFRSPKGAPMVAQYGKLAEETVLEIEEAFDFQSLDLSPEEGFLLSRIVGPRQTVKEVCEASGMARQDAMPILEQLVAKGVCTISEPWEEATALDEDELLLAKAEAFLEQHKNFEGEDTVETQILSPHPELTDEGLAIGFMGPSDDADAIDLVSKDFQPLVAEDTHSALTHALRARILMVQKKMHNWDHYTMLKVDVHAQNFEIESALEALQKEYDPQAYEKKALGGYEEKMQTIWSKMTLAGAILLDAQKRAKYDRALVEALPKHAEIRRELVKKLLQSAAESQKPKAEIAHRSEPLFVDEDIPILKAEKKNEVTVEPVAMKGLEKDFSEHNNKIKKLKERGRTNADRKARAQKKLFEKRLGFKAKHEKKGAEDKEQENAPLSYLELMGQAQTLIAESLLQTPLDDIYVVVENYLKLVGYHSNFQLGVLGSEAALVASGDGLGLAGPKMVVSVLEAQEAMTDIALSRLLESCPEEHQLLVIALGGYEDEAMALRKEHTERLTLLDAASLTRIIWQYYGHFDEETRTVFPLRTLLWPRRG